MKTKREFFQKMFKIISEEFGISEIEIFEKNNKRELTDMRKIIALILNRYGFRDGEIAKVVGKHRTSVIAMRREGASLLTADPTFRHKYDLLNGLIEQLIEQEQIPIGNLADTVEFTKPFFLDKRDGLTIRDVHGQQYVTFPNGQQEVAFEFIKLVNAL